MDAPPQNIKTLWRPSQMDECRYVPDGRKSKCSKTNLSEWDTVHYDSHTDCSGIEPWLQCPFLCLMHGKKIIIASGEKATFSLTQRVGMSLTANGATWRINMQFNLLLNVTKVRDTNEEGRKNESGGQYKTEQERMNEESDPPMILRALFQRLKRIIVSNVCLFHCSDIHTYSGRNQ